MTKNAAGSESIEIPITCQNIWKTVFKKKFYSFFNRPQRIMITIHLADIFYPVCIIVWKKILSQVPPVNENSLIEFDTAKSVSWGILLYGVEK